MIRPLTLAADRAAIFALLEASADYVWMEGEEVPLPDLADEYFNDAPPGHDPANGHRAGLFQGEPLLALAEMAFGCNDDAKVTGNVLEDEKAGFHWAYGRSDHLGGKVGLAQFRSPANVVHQDIVYAKGSPIMVARAELVQTSGRRIAVIRDGGYLLW